MRPEAHLGSLAPVPFEVGTTYRVSATLQMPAETGVHPAFWLRTDDTQRVGEIDVVESWGGKPRCERVLAAYYWRYSPPLGDKACLGDKYPEDMTEWHEYAVEFTYMGPGQDAAAVSPVPTRFFVDGVETWSTDHAPVAPEHMRLQVKRNCPDEEQPTCGETSTTPVHVRRPGARGEDRPAVHRHPGRPGRDQGAHHRRRRGPRARPRRRATRRTPTRPACR